MTKERFEKINKILKKEEHNFAAGFYASVVMDPFINGTFGATKALVECGKIDKKYEDELLIGFNGSSIKLMDIFNCDIHAITVYMTIVKLDKKSESKNAPYSGATGYARMLAGCNIITKEELASLLIILMEENIDDCLNETEFECEDL